VPLTLLIQRDSSDVVLGFVRLAIVLVALLIPVVAADAHAVAQLYVGHLSTPPELDGQVGVGGEWRRASQLPIENPGGAMVLVGWHGRWLYLAVRRPIAPQGILRRAPPSDTRDTLSYLDDCIDISWADSPHGPIRRVVVNGNDAVWDGQHRGAGSDWSLDGSWRSGVRAVSRFDSEHWVMELAIPLQTEAQSREILLRIALWARRPERAVGWPSTSNSEDPVQGLGRAILRDAAGSAPEPIVVQPTQSECVLAWPASVGGAALRVAWFPYHERLRVRLDLGSVPEASRFQSAAFSVIGSNASRPSYSFESTISDGHIDLLHQIPDLEEGSYDVVVRLSMGSGCEPLPGPRRHFEQRRFGWESNGLGTGDEVIPPFTPLGISGRQIHAVSRVYTLGDLGLPEQITSVDDDLLAGPIGWRIRTGDEDLLPAPDHPVRIIAETPGLVRSEADWSAGGIQVRTTGELEMDGMWRIELEISDQATHADQFDLVIPLRASQATLLNAITDGARHHTLGALPEGDGRVWSTHDARRDALDPDFVPYVWMGNEVRGLAWFSESRRGWWNASDGPSQEIVRRGDVVELVIHLAPDRASSHTRRIVFGLQATPAKPRLAAPEFWRNWQLVCSSPFPVFRICPLGSGLYWGARTSFGSAYPLDHDYSLLGLLADVRKGRDFDPSEIDHWLDDRGALDPGERDRLREALAHAFRVAKARPDALVTYQNVHGAAWNPEFEVYQDEWRSAPFGDRAGRDADERGEIKIRSTASWNDYLLWHMDSMLASGAADGFFFDNTYLKADFNEVGGSAFRDESGTLHPGVDIFSLRALLKRAQILTFARRGAWLNVAHMTTTPIVPVQVWSGMSVGGEWKYGATDFQDRFDRSLLRSASLGVKTGTVSVYLPGIKGRLSPQRRSQLERSLAGVTAVHEIRVWDRMEGPLETIWRALYRFGYGRVGTTVKRYWDADAGFEISGADAEALVVVRDGRALALVTSFGDAGRVEISFGPELGRDLPAGGTCRDLERGHVELEHLESGCRFPLPRHDFRLIAFEPGGSTP